MKTTKLISTLLVPALFTACSDDLFEANGVGNSQAKKDLVEVTIAAGIGSEASTRADFAEEKNKGIFRNFYFAPEFDKKTSNLVLTTNTAIQGDQVGLCLPSAAADGNVVTNVPFYIAGYQSSPDDDGNRTIYPLVARSAKNDFYKGIGEADDAEAAFVAPAKGTDKDGFDALVAKVKAETADTPLKGVDVRQGVFKSISGVMKGNYILYYPYKSSFVDQGQVPATDLTNIQTQVANNDATHVKGKLFAYSKEPFAVAGGNNGAKNMNMTPAQYFFQFRIFNSEGDLKWTPASSDKKKKIKLITVTTADGAKAFATKGSVKAGAVNTFVADNDSKVDLIGVDFGDDVDNLTSTTLGTKLDEKAAKMVYLSTYPVASELAGKDIKVRLYTTDGKVAEIVKEDAGKRILEGRTDFWHIDLAGLEFVDAEQLVYDEPTLKEAVAIENASIVLKSNVSLSADLTISEDITLNGEGYKIIVPEGITLTLQSAEAALNCEVVLNAAESAAAGGTLTVGLTDKNKSTVNSIATLTNYGVVTITGGSSDKTATLNVTNLTNGGYENAEGLLTTTYDADNKYKASLDVADLGVLSATNLVNNTKQSVKVSGAWYYTKYEGIVNVTGTVVNSTITNKNKVVWNQNMASTVTVTNEGTLEHKVGQTISGNVVNKATWNIDNVDINMANATVVNNGTLNNKGNVKLLGSTTFTNKSVIEDNNVFSGLSRLTNEGSGAKFIRSVKGYTGLVPALAEEKVTEIRVTDNIAAAWGEDPYVINTTKTIHLKANLVLSTSAQSSIGSIIFEAAAGKGQQPSITGKINTNSIQAGYVGTAKEIGAKSYIVVNGKINLWNSVTLEAENDAYVICDDIIGNGSVTGPIYVK